MVMATKLDNLTVDSSYSSSFSACATLERNATTTTTTNNTTAKNNLINEMQRLNLTSQTTNTTTTTTIITTPTCVASAQSSSSLSARISLSPSSSSSSSSSQSPTPSLLNNNNNKPTISTNSTHIIYSNAKQQHATNTNENICTSQNHQTNTLTCCKTTTHAIAGHNAFLHSLNTNVPPQTLIAHGTVGNINTVEPFLYLNYLTNHLLAINQNHATAMNNNNNKLSLNTNLNERFAMPNPKTTATTNATLKCADICNNFNIPNKPLECVNFHMNSNRLLDCSSKLNNCCCGI
ncbi:uncharacterized protein LOC128919919 [Zeugodacus cucurbitae]|uniref:uncharacterized protein LOC128919919 n=1 Tax=Zeugodacus cucurbitae TaxID=28588 RepID=UPI0023D9084C|nr:uncharacterized protein LOC128919919 [Zeugodacus cucurbitae]